MAENTHENTDEKTEENTAENKADLESTVAGIADELVSIAERLNEVSMTVLSRAIETGATQRPELERRISRARRTVDRAAAQLRGAAEPE